MFTFIFTLNYIHTHTHTSTLGNLLCMLELFTLFSVQLVISFVPRTTPKHVAYRTSFFFSLALSLSLSAWVVLCMYISNRHKLSETAYCSGKIYDIQRVKCLKGGFNRFAKNNNYFLYGRFRFALCMSTRELRNHQYSCKMTDKLRVIQYTLFKITYTSAYITCA